MLMKATINDSYYYLESLANICFSSFIAIFVIICPGDMIFVDIGLDWWWNSYSERGFWRIPDDGSIDKKTDVLWVHQSVKLRSATCQDSSSEQCYMFWNSRAQEINESFIP